MFEALERLELAEVDRRLAEKFQEIQMIGQMEITRNDFLLLALEVQGVLRGNPARLDRIPQCVLLTLLVFCARYEDTRDSFWGSFSRLLRLRSEAGVQQRYRKLLDESWKRWAHIYLPAGGYRYVTPILYHSILPQTCIEEMAKLIHTMGGNVGWDAVADLETGELEKMLMQVESRFHTSRPLTRFVTDSNSRQLAAALIQDLCEAAYLYLERGNDQTELLERLKKHPVQLEVWQRLAGLEPQQGRGAGLSRMGNGSARWQWDRKARQVRLYLPRQRVVSASRPGYYRVGGRRYPVESTWSGNSWQLEPVVLFDLPLGTNYQETVNCELFTADDKRLDGRTIGLTRKNILFFRPGWGEIGTLVDDDQGLAAGYWYVLLNDSYRLVEASGRKLAPIETHLAPRGLDDGYRGYLFNFKAGMRLRLVHHTVNSVEESDKSLEGTIEVTENHQRSLTLAGARLREADEPDGTETYTGVAPVLRIGAGSWAEIRELSLQIREMGGAMPVRSHSLAALLEAGQARWTTDRQEFEVDLGTILDSGTACRYRLKLLHGLQRSRYQPVEFNLVPATRFAPDWEEMAQRLFTELQPPRVRVESAAEFVAESRHGRVTRLDERMTEIVWSESAPDFSLGLRWGELAVQAQLHPAVLRCGIQQRGNPIDWNRRGNVWHSETMSFESLLIVESHRESTYRLVIGDIKREWKPFNAYGRLETPLADLKDNVNENVRKNGVPFVPISIEVRHRNHHYRMLVAIVNTDSDAIYEEGEPISDLREGQLVHHPVFGRGRLLTFTDTVAIGQRVHAARFEFDDFPGVTFFIPTTKRLRIYGDLEDVRPLEYARSSELGALLARPRLTCSEKGNDQ
ncbi:MAG: hypothetical protein RIR52_1126 [Acidobacteriota bacterium]|jgi:hypothetical protein